MPQDQRFVGQDEDVEDLDSDHDGPGTDDVGPTPGGPRGRRLDVLRSRWALPVIVALVVAVVGVAAVRQATVVATADLELARRLSAVQLSEVTTGSDVTGTGRHDGRGRLLVPVQLTVANSGAVPVRVTPERLAVDHAELSGTPAAVSVGARSTGALGLTVAVDCSALPAASRDGRVVTVDPADGSGSTSGSWLWLAVAFGTEGEGPTTTQRYLVPDSSWAALPEQLGYACDSASSEGVAASVAPQDDGRLQVDVINGSDGAITVGLEATTALRASAAGVELPAEVAAHDHLTLDLRLAPDCAEVGSPSTGGLDVHVDVVRVVDGTTSEPLTWSTSMTSAWAARQVALTCG